MRIHKAIGSKERFLEIFEGVTKVKLNEGFGNTGMESRDMVGAAFDELISGRLNIEQVNNQVNGDESVLEITGSGNGEQATFKFRVTSSPTDQDNVTSITDAKLIQFNFDSEEAGLGGEYPEQFNQIVNLNANRKQDILDFVSEYVDTPSPEDTVGDEMFEEAIKLIDKVPYKKSTETMQTSKAYGDQKPTNPEVRVHSPELQQYVSELQEYEPEEGEEEYDSDPLAMPPEFPKSTTSDDDGSIGVDPFDQEPEFDDNEEASPEEQALYGQAYDNLIAAGYQTPTSDQIEREVAKLQGNVKPVEKTRAIPKGAEEFWEGDSHVTDINADDIKKQGYEKLLPEEKKKRLIFQAAQELDEELGDLKYKMPKEQYLTAVKKGALELYRKGMGKRNESTDQDRYEDVVFMQGEEADKPLEILNNQGQDAAMEYLMQWHNPGQHMGSAELGHGSSDQTYEKDGYIMAWNSSLNYIGLQYELSGLDEIKEPSNPQEYAFQRKYGDNWEQKRKEYLDKSTLTDDDWKELDDKTNSLDEETEKNDYPDQMGKKFKPKNQMPKKKKKPQSVVKLSEEEVPGGKADDKDPVDFDAQQIMIGMGIEMEHTDDPKIALEIAMDHLMEIPDYYTRLDKMEKEAKVGDKTDAKAKGLGAPNPEEVDEMKNGEPDEELTDELLGFKPHNVGDYTNENEFADREKAYWDKEDMRQNPENYQDNVDWKEFYEMAKDTSGYNPEFEEKYGNLLSKPHISDAISRSNDFNMFMSQIKDFETINEEDGMEEYQGDIGDRYADGEGNQFTVRDKVKGGVTLQGQGGESEIATSDIKFLKKL